MGDQEPLDANEAQTEAMFLGDEAGLTTSMRRQPARRQVSLRWLSGAVLSGLTSVFLMGGALFAALDGRHKLTLPAHALQGPLPDARRAATSIKGSRVAPIEQGAASGTNVMMVSTVSREGSRNVVKVKPFLHVETPLAIAPKREFEYPEFNALAVFSDSGKAEPVAVAADLIYGAQVESEVTITLADFDIFQSSVATNPLQREEDIEEMVRNAAPGLADGTTTLASLSYFDPGRFSPRENIFLSSPGVTITAENVTVMAMAAPSDPAQRQFDERMARVRAKAPISTILAAEGFPEDEASTLEKILSTDLGSEEFLPEDRLLLVYETQDSADGNTDGEVETEYNLQRISVFRSAEHMVTVGRTDDGRFIYAPQPQMVARLSAGEPDRARVPNGRLPTAYDAIYRAALSDGLNEKLAAQLIRIFAFDVDFNSSIRPLDEMSVFVSLEDGEKQATENSEILFASVTLGSATHRYYRFLDPETGQVDYYDETGKSAKKFLLRQPVPNARFRSPFGRRYHPILKTRKMHWGVDWVAPRGTPILAAGNGVIKEARWRSGYGRHIKISHANGYVSSYSHQTRFAKGIEEGVRVRQGQIIGYVGSTGLSTGPHLHYEVVVNGTKVDPMRIRLPKGKVLEGEQLLAFQNERDRIDDLLRDEDDGTIDVAAR